MTSPTQPEPTRLSVFTLLGDIFINIEGVAKVEISLKQARDLISILQNCIEVAEDYSDE